MLSTADGDMKKLDELANSKEYKVLKAKKKVCMDKTEAKFFSPRERNGRGDRHYLLEELGDYKAVQQLFQK